MQGCLSGNSSRGPTKPILDIATPYGITDLFQKVAKGQILKAYEKSTRSSSTLRPEDVWNQSSIELTQSNLPILYLTYSKAFKIVTSNFMPLHTPDLLYTLFSAPKFKF